MRRLLIAATLPLLAACKVERTPPEYLTQRDPALVERQESAGELASKVRAFTDALGRGDGPAALRAVEPDPLVWVFGPGAGGGVVRVGPNGLLAAFQEAAEGGPTVMRAPDLRVEAGNDVAWFATHLERLGEAPERMRLSGVFERHEGAWRLVQLHLSRPAAEPEPAATAPRDSQPPSPPADGATPEGG